MNQMKALLLLVIGLSPLIYGEQTKIPFSNTSINQTTLAFDLNAASSTTTTTTTTKFEEVNRFDRVKLLLDGFSLLASLFIIFGGIIPYIPQYKMIHDTRNAQGFSTFVCLTIFVSSILRIFFWFGHPFELPLLFQCIVMVLFMIVMLELCVRVSAEQQLSDTAKRTITGEFFIFYLFISFLLLFV